MLLYYHKNLIIILLLAKDIFLRPLTLSYIIFFAKKQKQNAKFKRDK